MLGEKIEFLFAAKRRKSALRYTRISVAPTRLRFAELQRGAELDGPSRSLGEGW